MARPLALAVLVVALVAAACAPEPPPEAPASPAPPAQAVVAPQPPNAPGGATASPVINESSADPFVLSVDPKYCANPTPPTAAATDTTGAAASSCYFAYTTGYWLFLVPVWRSTDLVNWTQVVDDTIRGSALSALAPWSAFGRHWAPSVLERPANPPESRFVLWYTAEDKATGQQCLGTATAASPAGPFVDQSITPAYCQHDQGGTIDPDPFVDTDGTPYLMFKSQGVPSAAPSRLWASRLSADGRTVVAGSEHMLLEDDPNSWEGPVVEAPSMIRVGGALHLFYSGFFWTTAGYGVGVARCDSPFGPCRRTYATPVLASRGAMLGPGGQTPFQTAAGDWRMAFHAWTSIVGEGSGGQRRLRTLPLTFPGGNPAIG